MSTYIRSLLRHQQQQQQLHQQRKAAAEALRTAKNNKNNNSSGSSDSANNLYRRAGSKSENGACSGAPRARFDSMDDGSLSFLSHALNYLRRNDGPVV